MNTQAELGVVVVLLEALSSHPDATIDNLAPARKAEIENLLGVFYVQPETIVQTVAAALDHHFEKLQNTLVDEVARLKEQAEESKNRIAVRKAAKKNSKC